MKKVADMYKVARVQICIINCCFWFYEIPIQFPGMPLYFLYFFSKVCSKEKEIKLETNSLNVIRHLCLILVE